MYNLHAKIILYNASISNLQVLNLQCLFTRSYSRKTVNPFPVTFLQKYHNLNQMHFGKNNTPINLTTNPNPIYPVTQKSRLYEKLMPWFHKTHHLTLKVET